MASTHNMGTIYQGILYRINVSSGGVPKSEIVEGEVTTLGVKGDSHHDKENHGGMEKSVSLYAIEIIDELAAKGYNIFPGALGENLTFATTKGFDYSSIAPGDIISLGEEVKIQITDYDQPCSKISAYLTLPDSDRPNLEEVLQEKNPGRSRFYARVLKEGRIKKGDVVAIEKS